MAVLEKMTANMVGLTGGGGYGSGICGNASEEAGIGGESDQFPAGLRILVVDDDRTCLKLLERMLQKCLYQVTTCCQAKVALALLRERKSGFDLVISDVHMPDMDGFKLLEHVGLEMDLPVIMMSGDGRTSAVMRGIKHGACNYLIKPVRMEELKNIWQHVVRKKRNDNKEHENSGSFENSDRQKRSLDDAEYASSVNDVGESCWKGQKKKRESKEDEDDRELDNDDPSASKKPRVVWSVELHQQFVSAVNQLGVEKAVPKRILELMNVPGLTRENVASHLQKFRLYLRRLSGVSQHQFALSDSYCGPMEASLKLNQLGRFDLQTMAASSQIPPEALAVALHADLLGRTSSSKFLSGLEQQPFLQPKVPSTKFISVEHSVRFDQPPAKCHSNVAKQFPYSNIVLEDVCSGFSDCSAGNLTTTCSSSNVTRLNSLQNNNLLAQILPQEQSQQIISESSHATNFQPSYVMISPESSSNYQVKNSLTPNPPIPLIVPSHPSNSYVFGNIPATINCGPTTGFNLISSRQSNASLHVGQMADAHFKSSTFLSEYAVAGSLSSSLSSGVFSTNKNNSWRVSNAILDFNPLVISGTPSDMFVVQDTGISAVPDQANAKNLGFIGKGTCIPSRFVVDDIEFPIDNLSRKKMITGDNASTVKQEIQLDFTEGSKGGNPAGTPSFW